MHDFNTRSSIRTRYTGPTNHRGTRIICTDGQHAMHDSPQRITYDWDYALDSAENHRRAAQMWLDKFITNGTLARDGVSATISDTSFCFEGDYYHSWNLQDSRESK